MDPQQISAMAPVLQYGFAGVCLVLIGLVWWMVARLLRVLTGNTHALQGLTGLVETVKETSQDVRDRLLQWDCPFRSNEACQAPEKPR